MVITDLSWIMFYNNVRASTQYRQWQQKLQRVAYAVMDTTFTAGATVTVIVYIFSVRSSPDLPNYWFSSELFLSQKSYPEKQAQKVTKHMGPKWHPTLHSPPQVRTLVTSSKCRPMINKGLMVKNPVFRTVLKTSSHFSLC